MRSQQRARSRSRMRTPPASQPFLRTCVYTNSAPSCVSTRLASPSIVDERRPRQVLEHVERPRLGERAVARSAAAADRRARRSQRSIGFAARKTGDVDAGQRRAARRRSTTSVAAAAAAEIDRRDRRRRARRNCRSMSLRIFDPSTGGAIDSCRASACSASSRYFVCSANAARRPQIEEAAGRRSNTRPQPAHGSIARRAASDRPPQSGHCTTSSSAGEIIARARPRAPPRAAAARASQV